MLGGADGAEVAWLQPNQRWWPLCSTHTADFHKCTLSAMFCWFASPVGTAPAAVGIALLLGASACDAEPPASPDYEPGVSSTAPREPKTFARTGSFDGPHQNQHNWVEMSLGEDEDGDGVRELVVARPIDKSTNTTVAEAQGMVYVL